MEMERPKYSGINEHLQSFPDYGNGHCLPYFNDFLGIYYARDIYDGNIIKKSQSRTRRKLHKFVKAYDSPHSKER